MLDLFGNVFGRSKKSSSGQTSSKQETTTTDEDFVVVPNQANPPVTSLYPYIDFSELSVNGDASSTNAVKQNYDQHLTPLDKVPFVCNTNLPAHKFSIELEPYFQTIEKIDMFLTAPSMSDYNFALEKSFLSEYQ
ncbi:uncharacterized protein LOC107361206 isoform X1 [Tetranychus urticae]|uniref:uncharacterized protein LOC107361206 isoform X1 n=1 Tax=Tetranychus urticae TaxID=32264 RepID=UPI00077BC595|nr:uncharacterized protein LOC107361206 isoform X1 [Tetranychus urticae]XP_015783461.1 uncharacterized protein LOC107361206 isoform X1 [Tetranychus urticae]